MAKIIGHLIKEEFSLAVLLLLAHGATKPFDFVKVHKKMWNETKRNDEKM